MKEEEQKSWAGRLCRYFVGLFIMTIGIAVSVKSNLGVSPVSSIPYTMTRCWGIEMGRATILFHCGLVVLQVLILRKRFRIRSLLQIPVGIVFGYFTTFCNYLMTFLPSTENLVLRLLMSLLSAFFVAVGIFFYLPANVMPLAGEGVMQAVADVTGFQLSKVKVAFDCSMVLISLVTCLILLHNFGSVGVGTIISAVLVGTILGFLMKAWATIRKRRLSASKNA